MGILSTTMGKLTCKTYQTHIKNTLGQLIRITWWPDENCPGDRLQGSLDHGKAHLALVPLSPFFRKQMLKLEDRAISCNSTYSDQSLELNSGLCLFSFATLPSLQKTCFPAPGDKSPQPTPWQIWPQVQVDSRYTNYSGCNFCTGTDPFTRS